MSFLLLVCFGKPGFPVSSSVLLHKLVAYQSAQGIRPCWAPLVLVQSAISQHANCRSFHAEVSPTRSLRIVNAIQRSKQSSQRISSRSCFFANGISTPANQGRVIVVEGDGLPPVPAVHDVVDRTRILNSELRAILAASLAAPPTLVKPG